MAFDEDWIITEVDLRTQRNRLVKISMKSQPMSATTSLEEVQFILPFVRYCYKSYYKLLYVFVYTYLVT